MAMVCPQCNVSFEQRWHCPTCGVRLLYQAQQTRVGRGASGASAHWQQTPWGRIFIGLLLAQGLYYGLRHLCTAGLIASGEHSNRDVWNTLYGLIFLQGLQGLGLLVGGMLTGAGKRQGAFFGAVVGVWNGVISILVASHSVAGLTPVALYGQPVLQAAFGAFGGFLGSVIWPPLPRISLPGDSREARIVLRSTPRASILAGRITWWRILAGIALSAGGSLFANVVLLYVLEGSEGHLTIDSHLQAQIVTWEIIALAMLVGGALAGATTANGIKQGLLAGLGVAAVSVGIHMSKDKMELESALLAACAPIGLGVVGGKFGSDLFPRVERVPRKKGLGPMSV
jgi:hypothetical protein